MKTYRYRRFALESGLSGLVIVWPNGYRSELGSHVSEDDAREAMRTMQECFDLGASAGEAAMVDLIRVPPKGGVQ